MNQGLKLIVGKMNIENYVNDCCGVNGSPQKMDACQVTLTWTDSKGDVHPAIVIFEATDFSEIVYPS